MNEQYPIASPAQLGTHLRSLRKLRGLTQAQLGAAVGVDQTRIAKIEKDPGLVSIQQLIQLFGALDAQLVLQPRKARGKVSNTARADW